MPDRFVPLFQLRHKDGAEMTTIGGVLISWRQIQAVEAALRLDANALFAGGAVVKNVIDLIPITIKEKLALDRLLPREEAEFLQQLALVGIRLNPAEASKYRAWYNHFPVFAEMLA